MAGLVSGLSSFTPHAGAAGPVFYSNSADFNATLVSSFTETFASLPVEAEVTSPTNFAGNGFAFSAVTTSNNVAADPPSSLYSTANRWLTVLWKDDAIVLTNFSANIRAVGGNFFGTEESGTPQSSDLSFIATFVGAPAFSTNVTASGSDSFYGLTFDLQLVSLSIIGVVIEAESSYATIDNLTVGTVPEPSTIALVLLSSAALAVHTIVRRRRHTGRRET